MFCSTDWFHFNLKICFATRFLYAFKPVRNVNIVDEVSKPVAAYRHDPGQFLIDQIQLAAIEPETATVPTVIQNTVRLPEKSNRSEPKAVTARTFLLRAFGNSCFFFGAKLDGAFDFKCHFVELSRVKPKAAALFA